MLYAFLISPYLLDPHVPHIFLAYVNIQRLKERGGGEKRKNVGSERQIWNAQEAYLLF
jgi:hypothetical protein